ncbi:MAG: glycosyltransferase family 39 protein [Bryobacterales bacterium]|nr:glycosyltransferase family 39 protein [Bryobacterales bacterium]
MRIFSCGVVSAAAAAVFLRLALGLIPTLGLQNDETLFANGLYQPVTVADSLATPAGELPLMLVSYTGSLKTWLYAAVFWLFEPSLWTIRLPVALIGALSVALFVRLAMREAGLVAGIAAAGLLATDPAFLLTTCFDWGPVALQSALGLAAVAAALEWRRTQLRLWLLLAGLAAGLALWNKVLFLWTLGGLGVATALVFGEELRRRLSRWDFAAASAGLAAGAAPLLLYNWRTAGETFARNVGWELSREYTVYKLGVLASTLDSSALFGYMLDGGAGAATALAVVFFALTVATLVSPALRRERALVWALIAFWVSYAPMFAGRDVGVGAHHVALLWPLPHLAVAVAAGTLAKGAQWRRPAVLAGLGLMLMLNLRFIGAFRVAAAEQGPTVIWTDAIADLHQRLEGLEPRGVVLLDWGMLSQLRALGEGRLPLLWGADAFSEQAPPETAARLLAHSDYVFVDHAPGKRIFGGVREGFEQRLRQAGMVKRDMATLRDRNGRAVFEVFRVERVLESRVR